MPTIIQISVYCYPFFWQIDNLPPKHAEILKVRDGVGDICCFGHKRTGTMLITGINIFFIVGCAEHDNRHRCKPLYLKK